MLQHVRYAFQHFYAEICKTTMRTAVYGAESKLNVDGLFLHVVIFYFNAVNA